MAISSIILDWFLRLHRSGALPEGGNVLELGPQDIQAPAPMVRSFLAALTQGDTASGSAVPISAPAIYAALGLTDYHAADLQDPRADIKLDLSDAVTVHAEFDVLTNFGTLEHVFNPGEALRTIHRFLKPGGLALHILPAFGDINHGFWNVHPVIYTDLAQANQYETVDMLYIDNFGMRNMLHDEIAAGPFDFDSLPIKLKDTGSPEFRRAVTMNFCQNVVAPETQRLQSRSASLVYDYCFVALRKGPVESPFVRPWQTLVEGGS